MVRHLGLGQRFQLGGVLMILITGAAASGKRTYAQTLGYTLEDMLDRGVFDFNEMKNGIREEIARLVFKKTKRRPMILPIIMEV
jgi:mRNA degradation ribonuclease J1/J2